MTTFDDSTDKVNNLVRRFEEAWRESPRPAIADFLPDEERIRQESLWELVTVDLELRIKAGDKARVEDYLDLYPELLHAGYEERLTTLIGWEYRLRSRREPGLDPAEYQLRFPNIDCGIVGAPATRGSRSDEEPVVQPGLQRFRLIRPHAEGGLGKVWQGYDTELDREVAIKEIKARYADDESARRRFGNEARITSRLEHPGIVPIHGFGSFRGGRPFYAMRFIRGHNLREAIERLHQKSGAEFEFELRRLLQRLVSVCETIHFAHVSGIIHRDLKPRNIMLGEHGETLVLDWGLAKPIGEEDTTVGRTSLPLADGSSGSSGASTMDGHALGSPSYMSPEQAKGEQRELSPATDVFSLGATLFTVLTNSRPVAGDSRQEIIENVHAGRFRSAGGSIPRALDAICRKAMAVAQRNRYRSTKELAEDLERFLAGEPPTAHSESLIERGARLLRRHRVATMVGLVALAVSTVSASTAAWFMYREAATRTAVGEFAVESIRIVDPYVSGGDYKASYLLRKMADNTQDKLATFPVHQARYAEAFSESFSGLGALDDARVHAQRAVDLYRTEYGETSSEALAASVQLGAVLARLGETEEALPLLEEAADGLARHHGTDSTDALSARYQVAAALTYEQRWDEALVMLTDIKQRLQHVDPDLALGVRVDEAIGNLHISRGQFDDAVALLQAAHAAAESRRGADHPLTIAALMRLGRVHREQEQFLEAERHLRRAFDAAKSALDDQHPLRLATQAEYAFCLRNLGKLDEAIPLLEQAADAFAELLGFEHTDTIGTRNNLAIAFEQNHELERAAAIYEENVHFGCARLGPDNIYCLSARNNLANIRARMGQFSEAAIQLGEVLEGLVRKVGEEHPDVTAVRTSLAVVQMRGGQIAEGIEQLEAIVAAAEDPNIPTIQQLRFQVGLGYNRLGRHAEARQVLEALLADWNSATDGSAKRVASIQLQLAKAAVGEGDFEAAAELIEGAMPLFTKPTDPALAMCKLVQGQIEQAADNYERAETLITEALEILSSQQLDAMFAYRLDEAKAAFAELQSTRQSREGD